MPVTGGLGRRNRSRSIAEAVAYMALRQCVIGRVCWEAWLFFGSDPMGGRERGHLLANRLRHPRQPRWHVLRTVTQTSPPLAVTPVGGYGIGIRLTLLVFGSIRHSAPSAGVVAQM